MSNANQTLARLFGQMADIQELLGRDRFRINAFRRAARVLDELTDDVEDMGCDIKTLTRIEGIGKGTAQRIVEFLDTGAIADHADLMSQIPRDLIELLEIPNLGPKTIALMWKGAGVENLGDLKAKLDTEELVSLPGLGKKKVENLRKSIEFAESAAERVPLRTAMPLALWFASELRKLPQVIKAEYAGSLRRGRETIGDLDIIVAAKEKNAASISKAFISLAPGSEVLVSGATKTSLRTREIQVDLRIVPPESYGAALMYFTGSKDHNVTMRGRAIKRGMRLNEYALLKDGIAVAGRNEAEIFEALGLPWIAPELRENRDEFLRAADGRLPQLIELADIKAELHAHTTASDGKWTIIELAEAALQRGFHTVAVTDHSKGQAQANGLTNERLEEHIEAVRAAARQMNGKINILAGTEVDILSDGRLDYPDSLLRELDIVVASPHAALSQDARKATDRLIRAIHNRHVTIIGHATGRLIGRREGLAPDMKKVLAAAGECGVAMEINANGFRLDLRDIHARAAIDAGVRLAINTDAHSPADLDELLYGVVTARRAGAAAQDVINCLSKTALAKWLVRKR